MSTVKSVFRFVALKEVIEPITNWNPQRSSPNDKFTYIDLSAVDQDRKLIMAPQLINCEEAPSRARQRVRKGDVLVSTVRPNLNAVAVVSDIYDGAIASTGFCVVRPQPNKLDVRYLYHWVRTSQFISKMVQQATGASYPAVSDRIIRDSKIPLPPLAEQRRIADILDRADALRAKRRATLAQLDTLTQSIFLEMFGDPVRNPKRLLKKPLGELLKLKSGEFMPNSEMVSGGSYNVYGGNGITGQHNRYLFDQKQIVIGRVGAYCGCVHLTSEKSWVTDNALYVAEKSEELDTEYLVHALKYANLNQYSSSSGQPLVSGSRIYPIRVLLPTLEAQHQFAARVALVRRQSSCCLKSLPIIQALLDSCQYFAFNGNLFNER